MKTKMTLAVSELEWIIELSKKFETRNVTIKYDNSSGIGSLVYAEFDITHNEVPGKFTVVIGDESNW